MFYGQVYDVHEYFTGKKYEADNDRSFIFDLVDGIVTIGEYQLREMIREAREKDFLIRTKNYYPEQTMTPDEFEFHNHQKRFRWMWSEFQFIPQWTSTKKTKVKRRVR